MNSFDGNSVEVEGGTFESGHHRPRGRAVGDCFCP